MNLKRRTRLVTFRLDEDEYQNLRDRSIAHGARSISDYTRSVLCRLVGSTTEFSREALEAEVSQLRSEVERLACLVESSTAIGRPGKPEHDSVS